MKKIKLSHTTSAPSRPYRGGTCCQLIQQLEASAVRSTPATTVCNCQRTSSRSHTTPRPWCLSNIIQTGKISSSQVCYLNNNRSTVRDHVKAMYGRQRNYLTKSRPLQPDSGNSSISPDFNRTRPICKLNKLNLEIDHGQLKIDLERCPSD